MKQRIKTVSRIGQLIAHQKEALEMQVLQTRNLLARERDHLTDLKNQLRETIENFGERLMDPQKVTVQEVAFLFGTHANFVHKIENKNREVTLINETLSDQKALLLEAYQKEKVFGVFENKLIQQEKRDEDTREQKAIDFFTITKGSQK
jgi:hypothetical protein